MKELTWYKRISIQEKLNNEDIVTDIKEIIIIFCGFEFTKGRHRLPSIRGQYHHQMQKLEPIPS